MEPLDQFAEEFFLGREFPESERRLRKVLLRTIRHAVETEREECAQVAETKPEADAASEIASRIRARGAWRTKMDDPQPDVVIG